MRASAKPKEPNVGIKKYRDINIFVLHRLGINNLCGKKYYIILNGTMVMIKTLNKERERERGRKIAQQRPI